jgi:hypothetical protein
MTNSTDLPQIITQLSTFESGNLPKEALEAAPQHWPEIWSVVKQVMVKFIEHPPSLSESENNLLFIGLFLAVQQKEPEAYLLLSKLCERSVEFEEEFERLLDDAISELLPSFFYILRSHNTQVLEQLIISPNVGHWVKSSVAQSIFAQYESDLISRERLLELVTLWLSHFIPLANEASEYFLATVATNCIETDLHEFKEQLLALSNNFEIAPGLIFPENIEEWEATNIESIASGFIRTEFNVIDELSRWAAYKTPEQNAEDLEMLKKRFAQLEGINPDEMSDEYFDELLNLEDGDEILERLLSDDEDYDEDYGEYYGDYSDIYQPIAEPIIAEPKVGRNEPCLCGSGKKYKKCCLH